MQRFFRLEIRVAPLLVPACGVSFLARRRVSPSEFGDKNVSATGVGRRQIHSGAQCVSRAVKNAMLCGYTESGMFGPLVRSFRDKIPCRRVIKIIARAYA